MAEKGTVKGCVGVPVGIWRVKLSEVESMRERGEVRGCQPVDVERSYPYRCNLQEHNGLLYTHTSLQMCR